jgi:hypothetical protein
MKDYLVCENLESPKTIMKTMWIIAFWGVIVKNLASIRRYPSLCECALVVGVLLDCFGSNM